MGLQADPGEDAGLPMVVRSWGLTVGFDRIELACELFHADWGPSLETEGWEPRGPLGVEVGLSLDVLRLDELSE